MKDEKEFFLLMKLIDSPFKGKSFFGTMKTGCKKDIEKYLGFSLNSKEFNIWINELIEEGCFKYSGREPRGRGVMIDVFVINNKKLFNRLKRNNTYKFAIEFFSKRAFMGAIDES